MKQITLTNEQYSLLATIIGDATIRLKVKEVQAAAQVVLGAIQAFNDAIDIESK